MRVMIALAALALAGCAANSRPISEAERQANIRNALIMLQMARGQPAPGFAVQPAPQQQGGGPLVRTIRDGNFTICVYNRLGGQYAMTIDSVQLCPQWH